MMKRINIFYLLLIPCAYLLYTLGMQFQSEGAFFYGFAENKETELNMDVDCLITKVHISPGEEVKQGQLLLEASQAKYDLKLNDIEYDLREQKIIAKLDKEKLQNQIAQIDIKKQAEVAELDAEIRSLQAKIELNEKLFDQISSIKVPEKSTINQSARIKLQELKNSRADITAPLDKQITLLQEQIKKTGVPQAMTQKRLTKEKELIDLELSLIHI